MPIIGRMQKRPDLLDMIKGLISTPSVSNVNPEFDQGNRPVISLLANWTTASSLR